MQALTAMVLLGIERGLVALGLATMVEPRQAPIGVLAGFIRS